MSPSLAPLRGLLVLVVATATVAATWWLTAPLLHRAGLARSGAAQLGLDAAVAAGCAGVLLGCVTWVAAGLTLTAVAELLAALLATTGPRPAGARAVRAVRAAHRLGSAITPRLARRLVTTVLGAGVGLALAGPAPAVEPAPHPLSGLPLPDRVTGGSLATAARVRVAPAAAGDRHVVRPGDSLWDIAAARLPRSADDADVTRAWHRLHDANRQRVGADPDLIHPGTSLVVPDLLGKDQP